MKAVQLNATDGPGSLALADVDIPSAGQGTVLIDVAYAGVTFPELLQSRGQYQMKPPLPYTMGSEVAGTVRDVGEGATGFAVGDRVVGVAGTGAYAEVMAVPASSVLPLPETVSLQAGAGMPMNLLTADFALRVRGRLEAGQSVLIHGAAGGLGSALVQVALAYGAEVIAVVSTQEKAETVTQLGAQHVVLADGFKTEVKEIFPRSRPRRRPRRRRSLHRFPALPLTVRHPPGPRLHGWFHPGGQGQPPAAQQRLRRRSRLGRCCGRAPRHGGRTMGIALAPSVRR